MRIAIQVGRLLLKRTLLLPFRQFHLAKQNNRYASHGRVSFYTKTSMSLLYKCEMFPYGSLTIEWHVFDRT